MSVQITTALQKSQNKQLNKNEPRRLLLTHSARQTVVMPAELYLHLKITSPSKNNEDYLGCKCYKQTCWANKMYPTNQICSFINICEQH